MSVATVLEAAIPAAIAGVLTGITAGLVTVSRDPPAPTAADSVWVEPLDPTADGGGLGMAYWVLPYRLRCRAQADSGSDVRTWEGQLRASFHGRRLPAVSGLSHCLVTGLELAADGDDGRAVDLELTAVLEFHVDGEEA